jgi:hypothetical protein
MATIKYGGGVVQVSGSIAGTTHARNRFGNYIRARTKPVNPNSQLQSAIRDALSYLTNQWSAVLSTSQRLAWAAYAAAIPMKNRLGETIYLTGFNHFVRSNVAFQNTYGQYAAVGPTDLTLPAKDTLFTVAGSVATQLITVVYDSTQPWANLTLSTFNVYVGQPRKVSENFFAGPWKYGGAEIGVTGAPPASPFTFSTPYTLVLGQLITCYARIRMVDGRLSEPFTANLTVGA